MLVDASLLTLAVTSLLVWTSGTHSPVRLGLVVLSACLVPGASVLTRLSVQDPVEGAALAVGLGLTLEAIGTLAMTWTGFWHPAVWALLLMCGAGLLIAVDLRRNITTGDDQG